MSSVIKGGSIQFIYRVACSGFFLRAMFLRSFLHPVLSNVLNVIGNDEIVSPPLKSWLLVLNYKCTNKCVFFRLCDYICAILNLLR